MGNAAATAELNNVVNQSVSIMTSTSQDCVTKIEQSQIVNISDCNKVDIENVNFDQYSAINVSCTQDVSNSVTTQQKLTSQLNNSAHTINQALSLNPGSTTANAITNSVINVGTAITNSFSQSCVPGNNQSQAINIGCTGAGDSSAIIKGVNFGQYQNSVIDCVQTIKSVTDAVQDVQNLITNSAVAEVASIFGPILAIILMLIVFVIGFLLIGSSVLTSPVFWVGIISIFLIYIGLASYYKLPPFHNPDRK